VGLLARDVEDEVTTAALEWLARHFKRSDFLSSLEKARAHALAKTKQGRQPLPACDFCEGHGAFHLPMMVLPEGRKKDIEGHLALITLLAVECSCQGGDFDPWWIQHYLERREEEQTLEGWLTADRLWILLQYAEAWPGDPHDVKVGPQAMPLEVPPWSGPMTLNDVYELQELSCRQAKVTETIEPPELRLRV